MLTSIEDSFLDEAKRLWLFISWKTIFIIVYRNKEDQFISYNYFILNQLQAHKQLNHNNQQQNINSWRAQASFHPSLSIRNVFNPQKSFYHQLQVPIGATSHPRLLILLKVPAKWSYTRRATYTKNNWVM